MFAGPRLGPEGPPRAVFPLYHAAALFVKWQFEQILIVVDPEICAILHIANTSRVCYTYIRVKETHHKGGQRHEEKRDFNHLLYEL